MKTTKNGIINRVSISAAEVKAWNRRFPCSIIPNRACWFEFDDRNGDLVDMSPHLMDIDGSALLAFSRDAQSEIPNE